MMNSMLEPTSHAGTPWRRLRYSAMAPLPTCSLTSERMYALARMGSTSRNRTGALNQQTTRQTTRLSITTNSAQYGTINESQRDHATCSKTAARYGSKCRPCATAARSSRTYRYAKQAAVMTHGATRAQRRVS